MVYWMKAFEHVMKYLLDSIHYSYEEKSEEEFFSIALLYESIKCHAIRVELKKTTRVGTTSFIIIHPYLESELKEEPRAF